MGYTFEEWYQAIKDLFEEHDPNWVVPPIENFASMYLNGAAPEDVVAAEISYGNS